MDVRASGTTRLLGVIGTPIEHTGSPVMYNYCFNHYGIDAVYLAFETAENQVPETLNAIRRLNMRGANVTMPCKTAVYNNVDKLAPAARFAGAVNTIVNDNGVLTGHITDGEGVVLDLRDHGVTVEGQSIVLLGAGGAAGAILVQCALDGAKSITVFNRSERGLTKARNIGAQMNSEGIECEFDFHTLDESDVMHDRIRNADILINATSVGMAPMSEGVSLVTDTSVFGPSLVVYDVIYNPEETKLMADARAGGCKTVIGGKGMLLWQGACAFKLYTGLEMPVKELKEFLANREPAKLSRL